MLIVTRFSRISIFAGFTLNTIVLKVSLFLGAHHLDLRAATTEDPNWLLEQRANEIMLIKGWIKSHNDRKGHAEI